MSETTSINIDAKIAVTRPITNAMFSTAGVKISKYANLFSKIPPTFTTPACIKADTGVGASDVYGNQI